MSVQDGCIWSPLQEDDSRILDLRRGSPKNTIECHLENQKRDLDGGLPYGALRYM